MKTEQAPPLRTAAGADCVRAMYELAMECSDPQEKNRWLRHPFQAFTACIFGGLR